MINITSSSQITKIYLVTNCFGNPNKIYIGKTKGSRKNDHKKTYGQNINYDYIDEVNSLSREDWEPLETFWINYFRFLGFEIMNVRKKGGSGPEFHSELTKNIIKENNIGKRNKPVLQYDLEGNFIKEWESILDASIKLKIDRGNIANCCNKIYKTSGDFIWRHSNNPLECDYILTGKSSNEVIQFDLDWNFIKKFNSTTEASNELGIGSSGIGDCCTGKYQKIKNFRFAYANDIYDKNNNIPKIKRKCGYKVYIENNIHIFKNLKDIRSLGISEWNIKRCINSIDGKYNNYRIKKYKE